jgi:8-oxo-dGTP pyrophosphatase MutT (NUDIX family)
MVLPATPQAPSDGGAPGRTKSATRGAGLRSARARLRRAAYGVYYLVPPKLRRRLVRLALGRYTVGAVALVYDTDQPGRLLLLRHPRAVGWSLPAGLLRRGERPADGCVRELAEETGLRLAVEEITPAVPNAIVDPGRVWVDTVFEARVSSSAATFEIDGVEIAEAAWHRVDKLPALTIATARMLAHYGIGPYADYPEVRA